MDLGMRKCSSLKSVTQWGVFCSVLRLQMAPLFCVWLLCTLIAPWGFCLITHNSPSIQAIGPIPADSFSSTHLHGKRGPEGGLRVLYNRPIGKRLLGVGCSKFCLKVCCVLPIKVFLFELTYSLPGVCSNGSRTAHSCSSDPGALDDRTIRRCDLQADSLVAEECRESGSERARVSLQS